MYITSDSLARAEADLADDAILFKVDAPSEVEVDPKSALFHVLLPYSLVRNSVVDRLLQPFGCKPPTNARIEQLCVMLMETPGVNEVAFAVSDDHVIDVFTDLSRITAGPANLKGMPLSIATLIQASCYD